MKVFLFLKRKTGAFTLIEMLTALSLFSLAMLLIISLLGINLRILSGKRDSGDSLTGALLSRTINGILNNSYSITKENVNNFTVHSFDGRLYRFNINGGNFTVEEIKKSSRDFNFKNLKKISCDIKNEGRRYAFHMIIEAEGLSLDKWYLLGYRNEEGGSL